MFESRPVVPIAISPVMFVAAPPPFMNAAPGEPAVMKFAPE